MENSSKALIVAGSVILAILIITLGMYFYNQSTITGKGINMSEYEVKQFNSKFKMYEGKISSSQAKELLQTIERHNVAVGTEGIGVAVFASNHHLGGPGGILDNYIGSNWYTDTSVWYNTYDEIYDKCYVKDVGTNELLNNGTMLNGVQANSVGRYVAQNMIVENKTYYCNLLYHKGSGLILGIVIHN